MPLSRKKATHEVRCSVLIQTATHTVHIGFSRSTCTDCDNMLIFSDFAIGCDSRHGIARGARAHTCKLGSVQIQGWQSSLQERQTQRAKLSDSTRHTRLTGNDKAWQERRRENRAPLAWAVADQPSVLPVRPVPAQESALGAGRTPGSGNAQRPCGRQRYAVRRVLQRHRREDASLPFRGFGRTSADRLEALGSMRIVQGQPPAQKRSRWLSRSVHPAAQTRGRGIQRCQRI
jgi:hypothetical protein